MLKLFYNYIFYRFYWLNTKLVYSFIPVTSALVSMAAFISFNFIFILESINSLLFRKQDIFGDWGYYFIFGLILILNYIYLFQNKNYEKILTIMKKRYNENQFYTIDLVVIIYIITSIVLLALPIYNS